MMSVRLSLFSGPLFFALWFLGAQVLYFASGGGPNGDPAPSASAFPEAVLSNQSGINSGATLLVLAAVSLLWFAVGLRERMGSRSGLDLVSVLAMSGVSVLLILQAGLSVGSLQLADHAPATAWNLRELSGTLGFESFITSLLGGVALAVVVLTDRPGVSRWFWWFTVLFAAILTVGGLLEGLGITPAGRFSILFGLWVFVAGLALQTDQKRHSLPITTRP